MSSAGHVEQAIRGNGGVESTRGLPHIPLEILQQIACHLDRKSAFALTLTCKGLRDAGETKLYETVHLDHDYENLHASGVYRTRSHDEAKQGQEIVESRSASLIAAIRAYPYRAECIKHLYIEPSDGIHAMLIDIIRTVHKTIRSLFLEPRAASAPRKGEFVKYKAYTQPARDFRSHRFFAKLASMSDGDAQSLAFSQLETLDLHLPALVDGSLEKILITLGGVESRLEAVRLVLLPSSQFAGTRESARAAFRSTRKDDQLRHIMPSFPRLHRLDVNFPSDPDDQRMLGRYLGNILASAKNLVEFEMSGHSPTDLALEAFPRFADLHKLERVISFVSLERVSGVAELGMTEHATGLVLYVPDMTEMDELRSCNEEMRYFGPRTKATKRLTVMTSKRSPFEDYAQAGMRYDTPVHHDPHAADRDVGTRFLGYVKNRSPQLDTILYYYHPLLNHPYFPRTPHEHDFFVPPIRWEAEGHRETLARQCSLPRRAVPMAIIAKVYAESRMDRGWLEPGRDCTLPEAGCKVLTEWFEGLPQGYEDTASESETDVGAGGSNDEWDDDDAQAEFFDEEYGYYDNDDDYLYDDDIHQGW